MPRCGRERRGVLSLVAGVTAVAVVASACGTPGSETGSVRDAAGQRGGTLRILQAEDFQTLDPARNYVVSQVQLGTLLYPTLTTYANAAGSAGRRLVADAGTDTGKVSADGKRWTFTVRSDLKWEDGKPVSCGDFKYGVERSFSDVLSGGPRYQHRYLAGADKYRGPYVDTGGLPSVSCAGNQITYQLKQPVFDFNFVVTLPIFAAVRADRDSREKYGDRPFSYGPYRIGTRVADQRLELVRNPHWRQSADRVRKNLPDRFAFEFGVEPDVITDRLIQDQEDDQRAIAYGNTQVTPARAPEVIGSKELTARSVSGPSGYVWYLAVNTKRITDLNCRRALQYGVNKKAYLTAIGGPTYGEYATTMIQPGQPAYRAFDAYGLRNKPEGDPARARQLMSPKCPRTLTLDYLSTPALNKAAAAMKDAYARIGITLKLRPIQRTQYFAIIGRPATSGDLIYSSWIADWPSGSTVIPPLFDGRQIVGEGNQVMSNLNDPGINTAIDAALTEPNFSAAQRMWGALDERVARTGAVIPLRHERALFLVGSKVTGARLNAAYGDISLANVGVAQR